MNTLMTLTNRIASITALAVLLFGAAPRVWAHCDTLDGPIIPEARRALESGDLNPVLKWVHAEDEAEIRQAFEKTRAIRGQNEAVREMADHSFLETLIRVHRQGEGAPYTGLKPAGSMAPAFAAADQALDAGDVDKLADEMAAAVHDAIHQRFSAASSMKEHANHNVNAGREYVESYVTYIHFIEGLHEYLAQAGQAHGEPAPGGHAH